VDLERRLEHDIEFPERRFRCLAEGREVLELGTQRDEALILFVGVDVSAVALEHSVRHELHVSPWRSSHLPTGALAFRRTMISQVTSCRHAVLSRPPLLAPDPSHTSEG
jgi:hypothetical protein